MTVPQLNMLQTMARTLLADAPLVDRFRTTLTLLQQYVPYLGARIVVLQPPAWSFSLPASAAATWPSGSTAALLRQRQPDRYLLDNGHHYLGWPICWGADLLAVLEFVCIPAAYPPDGWQLVEALLPLLASAIADDPAPATALVPETQIQPLETLQRQIEAPLLLEPLAQSVVQWVLQQVPARSVTLHVACLLDAQTHLLAFSAPHASNDLSNGIRSELLAQTAIEQTMAVTYQNGGSQAYALPIQDSETAVGALVVVGDALRREHLQLLVTATAKLAPALQRALVYQQVSDERARLQQIVADLPTGLALTDSDGRLLHANPAWARLWGVPEEALQPGHLVPWDMFGPLLQRLPDPIAFDAFFGQRIDEVSSATLTLQQPYQLLRVMRMPLRQGMQGRPLLLFVLNDVTRELEAERAKTEFVSVVSHELRTPLTSILGYTELLRAREFAAAERFELIDIVWKQATHLSTLVEDLLSVSRIDAGRLTLTRWVISTRQLVTELIAQLNKQLDRRRHQLLIDIDPRLPPIYADRDRVRQILSNLLSNAIKYSPEGGEIVLRAQVLHIPPPEAPPLPSEPALLFSVRDPGLGIEPSEQQRIFERFYRIDNTNTRRIGGTGLGLSITKALVELHGGRIWVTSQPGEGSIFWFTLPIATEMVHTV